MAKTVAELLVSNDTFGDPLPSDCDGGGSGFVARLKDRWVFDGKFWKLQGLLDPEKPENWEQVPVGSVIEECGCGCDRVTVRCVTCSLLFYQTDILVPLGAGEYRCRWCARLPIPMVDEFDDGGYV